jgi:hypothetical protein
MLGLRLSIIRLRMPPNSEVTHTHCLTRDEFREVLKETLEEHFRTSLVEHGDHHAWLKHELQIQQLRRDRNRKFVEALTTWVCLGSLGWVGSILTKYVTEKYFP